MIYGKNGMLAVLLNIWNRGVVVASVQFCGYFWVLIFNLLSPHSILAVQISYSGATEGNVVYIG